jgi:hypothetical protein
MISIYPARSPRISRMAKPLKPTGLLHYTSSWLPELSQQAAWIIGLDLEARETGLKDCGLAIYH